MEGAEVEILREDRPALARCQQLVIELHDVEYHGHRHGVEDLRAMIQDQAGFRPMAHRRNVHVFARIG